MERIEYRTGELYFKDGEFFEKVDVKCKDLSKQGIEFHNITEEIMNTICKRLSDRDW